MLLSKSAIAQYDLNYKPIQTPTSTVDYEFLSKSLNQRQSQYDQRQSQNNNVEDNNYSKASNERQLQNKNENNGTIYEVFKYYNLALDKYNIDDYKGALSFINKSIGIVHKTMEIDTNLHQCYGLRGSINKDLGNFNEAVEDFTKAIQLSPFDIAFYYHSRGQVYAELGKNIEAIKDLTRVIKIDPDYLWAYFTRASVKSDLGDIIGAINDYDYLISKYDGSTPQGYLIATVYNNKAYAFVKLHKYKEALILINKAVSLEPFESYSWSTKGEIHYKLQQYKQCIESMDYAIKTQELNKSKAKDFGDGQEKYYYRGMSKIKLGNKGGGCVDLSKSGELGNSQAYEDIKKYCN